MTIHYHQANCPYCGQVHSQRGCDLNNCTTAQILTLRKKISLTIGDETLVQDQEMEKEEYLSWEYCPETNRSYSVLWGNLPYEEQPTK